jgi:cytochrome c oxidase assembly protein subunit 15
MSSELPNGTASPWPHRFALATLCAAVPLVVFGGSVTTLEAGMAIEGWLLLEPGRGDHFLLFYPVEKWFRDLGTFVEHTHRLFGTLVGLLAIGTLLASLRAPGRPLWRRMACLGLLAICAQGALGGFRVLEASPKLAFLHGALGQAVFALLAVNAVVLSPRWSDAPRREEGQAAELRRAAAAALAVLYGTIFAGAWLRHGGSGLALVAHIVGVMLTLAMLLGAIGRIQQHRRQDLSPLRGRLIALLGVQVLLGLASFWLVFFSGAERATAHRTLLPTLHVLVGALMLAQTAALVLWAGRDRSAPALEGSRRAALTPGIGGAA